MLRGKFFFLISFLYSLTTSSFASQYAVYIDAGSTGSRLHVFQYDNNATATIPMIKDVFSTTVKPGLSSFQNQPELAALSLKKLLNEATAYLQKNGIDTHQITINVLATAGMRLLPEQTQQLIYTGIDTYLKKDNQFKIGTIKTITGKMEAIYGWLDVNYLLENFQHYQPTVGSIDMGGASTQIAFATDKKTDKDNLDLITIKIGNQNYTLSANSFLGLGQDKARSTMTDSQSAAACYPLNYFYQQTNSGAFNIDQCSNAYQNIIQAQLNGIKIPIDHSAFFVAYSGLYFNHNFFGMDQTPDQTKFEQRLQSVCTRTWDDLKIEYPNIPEKFLSAYCADGVYHDQLIYHTYRIDGSKLQVKNKLNNLDIDWTLGALLYDIVK